MAGSRLLSDSSLRDLSFQERTNMKTILWKCLQVACLILWPILTLAQSSNFAQNLEACKAGRQVCDQSKLSPAQSADVALAAHGRNVANCRNRYDSCDRSKLSEREAMALAVADHQHNVSDCNDGMQSCDRSKLTPAEARDSSTAERLRNLTDCKDGVGSC